MNRLKARGKADKCEKESFFRSFFNQVEKHVHVLLKTFKCFFEKTYMFLVRGFSTLLPKNLYFYI